MNLSWQAVVEKTVTGLGYEVVGCERSAGGLLRVFIDKPLVGGQEPEQPVNVEDCERVTRQLRYVMEVEEIDYTRLEVSTPGLDRQLNNAGDYARFLGHEVEITLREAFQGRKKYRGVPVKLWSTMLTGMGAVATPVEVSELATALATGLVVGQENPLPNIYNLKLYEVQKFVMLTGHMQSVLSVFVNERIWQGIPAADRKIIEDTMMEVGRKTLDWDKETAAKYRKDLEAKGMTFVEAKDGQYLIVWDDGSPQQWTPPSQILPNSPNLRLAGHATLGGLFALLGGVIVAVLFGERKAEKP